MQRPGGIFGESASSGTYLFRYGCGLWNYRCDPLFCDADRGRRLCRNVFVFSCFSLVYGIYNKIEKRIFPLVRENRKEDESEDLVMFLASGPFFVAVYDERKSDEPVHRKSPKTTIDKSKRRGYDCVTRLRAFLKFTGISSQDPKRVLQQKKGGAQRLWARCTICCMIKIKMRQMKK